jgi:hypothetical protein
VVEDSETTEGTVKNAQSFEYLVPVVKDFAKHRGHSKNPQSLERLVSVVEDSETTEDTV